MKVKNEDVFLQLQMITLECFGRKPWLSSLDLEEDVDMQLSMGMVMALLTKSN